MPVEIDMFNWLYSTHRMDTHGYSAWYYKIKVGRDKYTQGVIGERDTYRGNTIENRGCLFVYMFGCTYIILYFDRLIFLCYLAVRPCPKLH